MASGRGVALLAALAIALAACGVDVSVTAERADQIVFDPTVADPTNQPAVAPDPQVDPDVTTPTPATTVPVDPPSVPADPTAIDFGPDKPPRAYDDFLLAVMTDLQLWWDCLLYTSDAADDAMNV